MGIRIQIGEEYYIRGIKPKIKQIGKTYDITMTTLFGIEIIFKNTNIRIYWQKKPKSQIKKNKKFRGGKING